MVRRFLLNANQRETVKAYLRDMPSKMPGIIKSVRFSLARTDLDEMESDLVLMRELKNLHVKIGRTKGEWKYDQLLNAFMELGEPLSAVIPKDAEVPVPLSSTLRQTLKYGIEKLGLPIRVSVIDDEVYLERTDSGS